MKLDRPPNSHLRRDLVYGLPVMIYAALIFLLSSLPQLPEDRIPFVGCDKLAHLVEYFLFGILLCRWLLNEKHPSLRRNAYVLTMLIGVGYGISDEWHQSFIPGRFATGWDALFDAIGVVAALFTYPLTMKRYPALNRFDRMLERRFIHEP